MKQPSRRYFLKAAAATAALSRPAFSILAANPVYRAVIIGHTGRGNFGHDQDLLFTNHDRIQLLALADPDPAGRAKAAARAKPLRQYDDYRAMLEKEKPDLVSIAPRFTEQHHEMAMAALAVGAHVISEKPFMTSLAEADEVLGMATKLGLKIAVSHQIRLSPVITFLKARLDGGLIGQLMQLHAHGKQDARAGGEDMVVLGCHQFDLLRLFAGDAHSCSARITQNGHEISKADAHAVKEAIGPDRKSVV